MVVVVVVAVGVAQRYRLPGYCDILRCPKPKPKPTRVSTRAPSPPRMPFSTAEEEALRSGVQRHGAGAWATLSLTLTLALALALTLSP